MKNATRGNNRKWLILALCAILSGMTALAMSEQGAGQAKSDSGKYALDYSQITNGASVGTSYKYSIVDTINVTGCDGVSQTSNRYDVINPVGEFEPIGPSPEAGSSIHNWSRY